jgi:hypothetical protein
MSADAARRQRVGSALRLAGLAVALTVLVVLAGWALTSRPSPTGTASPSGTASPTVAQTASAASIRCAPESAPVPSLLASDPCPDAIVAVQLAVAPVRLPIERLVIEPGPFYCDVIWPGVGSPRACPGGYAVRPGQFMHAWVAFRGTDEVAAVMLGLDLPDNLNEPGATRPPWLATLVAVEVPPAGWVMP